MLSPVRFLSLLMSPSACRTSSRSGGSQLSERSAAWGQVDPASLASSGQCQKVPSADVALPILLAKNIDRIGSGSLCFLQHRVSPDVRTVREVGMPLQSFRWSSCTDGDTPRKPSVTGPKLQAVTLVVYHHS